jgi:hypothetical protein
MLYFREWHFGVEDDISEIHVLKFRPADTNSFLCIHTTKYATTSPVQIQLQWNLDLSFFKGMEKKNDEWRKMINPGNYYTL